MPHTSLKELRPELLLRLSLFLYSRFSMPHTPLKELKPELFLDEYQTDSEDGGFEDSVEEEEHGEIM